MTAEQIPIRLQADLVSNPPVAPIDANTGLPPQFWRGQSVAISFGVFASNLSCVDLSNLQYLQLILQNASDSLYPIATITVNAEDIIPTITRDAWLAGTAQQATFTLSAALTDQGLGAMPNGTFWISVQGVTELGSLVIYTAGNVTIYNPGTLAPATIAPYKPVSATYAVQSTDYTVDCTSGTFTATLETAISATGRIHIIKNSGSGTITVATSAAQLIDGAATVTITAHQVLQVQSNGANWIKIN